ncbi:glycosyltransferase family 4 protein [Bacillus sp. FJAT-42315]|uniref:glycosyltransferase family 4 protein n=1 Tax=Bacillus sp. FJAT-42315 TaxID=2014077 RepID=UPI000C238E6A|nr:glycosyltransferase family 4 protein [Bacillus sp. FJAT-42315]
MNILWLVNIPLPEASRLFQEEVLPFGGWLVYASESLSKRPDVKLSVSFPRNRTGGVQEVRGENIQYYAFAPIQSPDQVESLKKVIERSKPDIVHIFGTEFAHTLAMVNVCEAAGVQVVISIQGLVSVIAKHYTLGLPHHVQYRFTVRDILKLDNIKQRQKRFIKLGKWEVEAIQKAEHIIGRTTWDRACTSFINPAATYHYCNETLRNEFYQHEWDIDHCERYSIFLSQGSYPIKGLHFAIEAMPLVLKRFPNAKLYVGGHDITKSDTWVAKLKISSYGKYIKKLIEKYNLQRQVIFTGMLNEKQMCARFLASHVFACPSSIENSPNSLGEAMLLGVPSIASHVGGVTDLLSHQEEGFVYPSDAPYMLAHYICEIFADDQLALQLSKYAKRKAAALHNREMNDERLLEIYFQIASVKGDDLDEPVSQYSVHYV